MNLEEITRWLTGKSEDSSITSALSRNHPDLGERFTTLLTRKARVRFVVEQLLDPMKIDCLDLSAVKRLQLLCIYLCQPDQDDLARRFVEHACQASLSSNERTEMLAIFEVPISKRNRIIAVNPHVERSEGSLRHTRLSLLFEATRFAVVGAPLDHVASKCRSAVSWVHPPYPNVVLAQEEAAWQLEQVRAKLTD